MKINKFFYALFFVSFFCLSIHAEELMLDEKNYESLDLEDTKPEITELIVYIPVSYEKIQFIKNCFPSLIRLRIMSNLISGDEFQELMRSFPNLEVLDVAFNKVKQKEIPLFTVPMPHLKQLYISFIDDPDNQIEAMDFKNLAEYAPCLELLDASFNHVNYFHAVELQHFKKLKTLILRSTELEDASIQFIEKLSEINVLDLSHTRIHSFAVNLVISKMVTLRDLSLGQCNIGKSGIRNIVKSMKGLNCLSLPFTEVEDVEVKAILEGLSDLEQLDISKNCISEIGYDYLIAAIKNKKYKLKKLKISPCKAKYKTEIESANLKTQELMNLSGSFEKFEMVESYWD
jgi:Leucine-rich repeat (LRR) protein